MILGLAGGASALAALGAGGAWLALSQSRMGTTHLKPSVSPTPNAEATAQVLVNEAKSRPSMISLGSGLLDLFVRDTANALWRRHYDGTWHAWESLGGSILAGPAATSWGPNRLDVFVRGADSALWHIGWDVLLWGGWESLGGSCLADPAATSWGPNRLDVFTLGSDATLQHIWFDGSTGASWRSWESLGGQLA